MKKFVWAAASGLLLTAAFPKTGISALAWIALVPLMVTVRGMSMRESFRIGMLAGLIHYLTLLYWVAYTVHTFGHLPWLLAVPVLFLLAAYLSLFLGLFAAALPVLDTSPATALVGVPMLWVALEYVRAFLFSGFPWELLAYSQYRHLDLIQSADLIGPFGLSFLIVLANCVFLLLFSRMQPKAGDQQNVSTRLAVTALAGLLLLAGLDMGYGRQRIRRLDAAMAAAPHRQIAVIQGNIAQEIKWDPKNQLDTLEKYFRLSDAARPAHPDLIVWPETAAPFYFLYNLTLTRRVQKQVAANGHWFLIGSPSVSQREGRTLYFNSAYLLTPAGLVAGRYDKSHLVPFGEYVPFKNWLPFLGKIVEQVGDFQSGQKGSAIAWQSTRIGVLICYEAIFAPLARAEVANGAGLLVNMTNDAWYGRSSAPFQHFSMAVFRAVENRRALVRAANTGISGFIDPAGRILAQTPLFEDAVRTRSVPLLSQESFYTRHGDWFAAVCLMAAGIWMPAAAYRRRRSKSTP